MSSSRQEVGDAMAGRDDGAQIRAVIVDDQLMFAEMLERRLRRAGIAIVDRALDGRTAVRLVAEHRPDVLILDIGLPDVSGIEVARHVRETHPATAVVVLTGYPNLGYARSLLAVSRYPRAKSTCLHAGGGIHRLHWA
jgi:DNA-binding NarL/FixJ family response regulator